MVSVFEPAVLLTIAWLLVLFVTGWRYRFGSMPPTRALGVVAATLLWLAYSLTQFADFLASPYDDVVVAVATVLMLSGAALFWRWWRTR